MTRKKALSNSCGLLVCGRLSRRLSFRLRLHSMEDETSLEDIKDLERDLDLYIETAATNLKWAAETRERIKELLKQK